MAVNKALKSEFSSPQSVRRRIRDAKEFLIRSILFLCATSSVLITFGVVWTLLKEAWPFFQEVSLKNFFFDKEWTPLFENPQYGILNLISGTFLTTLIALSVAIPLGTITAVFLSEYASSRVREFLKPVLELLAAVPTVVYGYFALLFVTPLLQVIFPSLSSFNALSAGLVMGVMIIPYVSSLSEDAMRAVPVYLREGSLALGASNLQTSFKVIVPSAFSGIASAYVLGISRALGETMVVAIAAGLQPKISLNPFESTQTLTAYIVQVSQGDLPHGSIGYKTIYVAGVVLLCFTLIFNMIGQKVRSHMEKKYK
ncbi:phosphate ABC transporter permease subunit PstC [Pseudobdellovibrio exovorus]|uniref:Phosphate transport system permease protein n=1 Tax=Pseudobdellovibrio exovorus JSS TaxID=1184267 RepID=M4VCE0_9BACT|nr:phosphate ABC transporter permease subunit PstC [Pseudobdellovibrio exovorus]AGH95701.1 phosphate ABC transporter permease [Pseudobdellovibrio exovorus JSS]